jgi:hypothetical protein
MERGTGMLVSSGDAEMGSEGYLWGFMSREWVYYWVDGNQGGP